MRIRNTVIALVLLAIVGGYAFVMFRYSKPVPERPLLAVKAADIAKIDLKYPGREIVIERPKGGKWQITAPIGVNADQTVANNLARAIADAKVHSVVEKKAADLAPFGLANPIAIVKVTTYQHKTLPAIDVGKTTPVGFHAYVKLSDSPAVLLTASAFPSGMNKTVSDLRNRELMNFSVDDVTSFTLDSDNQPEIDVVRKGGNWMITKPGVWKADPTAVRLLLTTLANTKVAEFVENEPSSVRQYGLEKPHFTIAVNLKDGTQESLLFGFKQPQQGKDGIYVRRGGATPVYTVHEYVMNALDRTLFQLRNKTVMAFEPMKVQSVKAAVDGNDFTIVRAPKGKWNLIQGGKTTPADVAVVERFLDEMRGLRGRSIVVDPMKHPQLFGMDQPQVVLTVVGKDGKQIGVLKLSKIKVKPAAAQIAEAVAQPHTDYYAYSTAGTALYGLDGFNFSQLDKPAAMFAARTASKPAAARK